VTIYRISNAQKERILGYYRTKQLSPYDDDDDDDDV